MSHVGDGSRDLEGLEDLDLTPEVLEQVKQARIEARGIIDSLEPFHITGWGELFMKLDDAVAGAKRAAKICGATIPHRQFVVVKPVGEEKLRQLSPVKGVISRLLFELKAGWYFFVYTQSNDRKVNNVLVNHQERSVTVEFFR